MHKSTIAVAAIFLMVVVAVGAFSMLPSGDDDKASDTQQPTPEVPITFTVSLQTADGNTTMTVDKGNSVTRPEDPICEGFIFAGWYSDMAMTVPYDFSQPVNGDIVLYAKFLQKTDEVVVLVFQYPFLSDSTVMKVIRDTIIDQPVGKTMEGYDFAYWYTDDPATPFDFTKPIEESMYFCAKYVAKEYVTATFDCGKSLVHMTVEKGTAINENTATNIQGYTFNGWYKDPYLRNKAAFPVTLESDVTFYGAYEPICCEVVLHAGQNVTYSYVDYDKYFGRPADPSVKGCVFSGWYLSEDFDDGSAASFPLKIKGPIDLYAKFDVAVTINFCTEGGVAVDSMTVISGSSVDFSDLPTTFRSGFEFGGWNNSYDLRGDKWVDGSRSFNKNTTLYAMWNNDSTDYTPSVQYYSDIIGTYTKDNRIFTVVHIAEFRDYLVYSYDQTGHGQKDRLITQMTVNEGLDTEESISTSLSHQIGVSIGFSFTAGIPELISMGLNIEFSESYTESYTTTVSIIRSSSTGITMDLTGIELYKYYQYGLVGTLSVYKTYNVDPNGEVSVSYIAIPKNCVPKIVTADDNSAFCLTYDRNDADIYVDGGDGTKSSPYMISDFSEFTMVYFKPQSSFAMSSDIDMNEFPAIAVNSFSGLFDGCGHSISNVHVRMISGDFKADQKIALFGQLTNGGCIRNITIANSDAVIPTGNDGGWKTVAILCHTMCYGSSIEDVTIRNSSIEVNYDQSYSGIICGYSEGSVRRCTVENCSLFSNGDMGPMVGWLCNGGMIDNCTSSNNTITHWAVNNNRSTGGIVGGFVSGSTIKDCSVSNCSFVIRGQGDKRSPCMGYVAGYCTANGSSVYMMGTIVESCNVRFDLNGGSAFKYNGSWFFGAGAWNHEGNLFKSYSGLTGMSSDCVYSGNHVRYCGAIPTSA